MPVEIPENQNFCTVKCGHKKLNLTNLNKIFWPELGKTKRDLIRYYSQMAPVLIPHLKGRALVLKRYPDGIAGELFVSKRTPAYKPDWLDTCLIEQKTGTITDFPIVDDEASLLWIVNLGCIDLNPWYGPCDDVERPDYLHFDLDPVPPAGFEEVQQVALKLKAYLDKRVVSSWAKTTGSRGIHVYVPLFRKAVQQDVWAVAKRIATELAKQYPEEITVEYRPSMRPPGRVLIDYNQNAWGKTLASVYSIRPVPAATVSAPVTWRELKRGVKMTDFTIDSMPARIKKVGDLFAGLLDKRRRHSLESLA